MTASPKQQKRGLAERLVYGFARHWFLVLTVVLGIWVTLPWLAPLFMELNWPGPARFIYLLYAPQCHQLPQRSFFLFGDKFMYSLDEIQMAWQETNNPLVLRRFVGNSQMGWKVAWSDRMVAMYTTIPLLGLLYWPLRRRVRLLPFWGVALLLLPMFIDGTTHAISDFTAGIGAGFRYTNLWLAELTNHALPPDFYEGNGLGSFNSWMRLLTGLLFGLAVVWFTYPRLDEEFSDTAYPVAADEHTAAPLQQPQLSPDEPR